MVWIGLKRWRAPVCGPSRWSGMPSANTLPVVASRQAAATASGVMKFSVPISSAAPHRPQFRTCIASFRSVSSLMAANLTTPGRSRADNVIRARSHRSEEHTSELQSLAYLVCRLLLEKKNNKVRSEEHTSELQSLSYLVCPLLL